MIKIIGTVKQLVEKLSADQANVRESAVISLCNKPHEEVLPLIAEILKTTANSDVQNACLDVAKNFDATLSLTNINRDTWFDDLAEGSDNFEEVSLIVGPRYLAYSIILGVQIVKLIQGSSGSSGTVVHFNVGDGSDQVLPLGSFRSQVAAAFANDISDPSESVTLPLEYDMVATAIGNLNLLIAPLSGLSLKRVVAYPQNGSYKLLVGYISNEGYTFAPLDDITAHINKTINSDMVMASQRFNLDLSVVDSAKIAFESSNYSQVIEILETWPGLLSTMLKTPEATKLTASQIGLIALGLRILGTSYFYQNDAKWAEDLYRLGLQYARDTQFAGELYLSMGILLNKLNRHGEAIGYFKRALNLGDNKKAVLPRLGNSLLLTGKMLCARLVLNEAITLFEKPSSQLKKDYKSTSEFIKSSGLLWPK